jgi:HAD superfamily hydrolase (TIGR01509 family)
MGSREGRSARPPVFIFDFGGVVLKWKNNNPIFDDIADRYQVPRAEMRRALELGIGRLETGDVTIRALLTEVLGQFGKRLRRGDSAEELWTAPFARQAKLRLGMVRLVESLRRRGYKVFLFSNTSLPHARFLRKVGWDKPFDGFLSSCELRSMKPAGTAFARALERINAAPSDVVFIDDREDNVRGAKEYGIRWAFRFTTLAQLRKDIATVTSALPTADERTPGSRDAARDRR